VRTLPSIFILLFLLSSAEVLSQPAEPGPVVQISSGSVRGYLQGTTAVFKGIPYAAPPVGDLRWREPQPPSPWSGIREATKAASACVQDPAGLGPFIQPLAAAYGASYEIQPVSSSEDCLYLNVWAPMWPPRGSLPVMVWLHGGSNAFGSGSQSIYDGTSLASHGVIPVTINYRLGILGFFSHPELTAESPHHSSGNDGLLDQLAALQWVKENIARFGGDPENVTLFGESAGAIDASALMTSPLSAHLFRRVIVESGPPFGLGPIQTRAQAEAVGVSIGKAAPGNSPSPLANLRKLPSTELLRLANTQLKGRYLGNLVLDGWILPEPPARAFASGAIQKVDLMVGLNGRELSAFRVVAASGVKTPPTPEKSAGPAQVFKRLAETVHPLYGGWTDAAIALYLFKELFGRDLAIDQASNDMLMACPIGAMAALTRAQGPKVFVYKFDRTIPGKGETNLGAFHSLELPYVFNAMHDRDWRWLPFAAADDKLASLIETYWTNFAKSGDPNSPGAPHWPGWERGSDNYLEFARNGAPVAQQNLAPPFCDLSLDWLRKQLANSN
jgi:para-nitrobenzyl esterase